MNSTVTETYSPQKEGGFFNILGSLRNGHFIADVDAMLKGLVRECIAKEGGGQITMNFKVKYDPKTTTVQITPKVECKMPKPPETTSLYYATVEGNLQRSNPNQPNLPFKERDDEGWAE